MKRRSIANPLGDPLNPPPMRGARSTPQQFTRPTQARPNPVPMTGSPATSGMMARRQNSMIPHPAAKPMSAPATKRIAPKRMSSTIPGDSVTGDMADEFDAAGSPLDEREKQLRKLKAAMRRTL